MLYTLLVLADHTFAACVLYDVEVSGEFQLFFLHFCRESWQTRDCRLRYQPSCMHSVCIACCLITCRRSYTMLWNLLRVLPHLFAPNPIGRKILRLSIFLSEIVLFYSSVQFGVLYCAFLWPKQSAIEFCPQSWRSGIVFSLPVKSVCCPCDFKLRAIFVFWCMDRSCWRATGSSHWRGFYVKLGSMLVGTQCCIV